MYCYHSSDRSLRNLKNDNIKKVYFNNFTDIKIEIDGVKFEPDIKTEPSLFHFEDDFKPANYKDIIIKKVNVKQELTKDKKEQILSVEEFLNTIKDEIDENVSIYFLFQIFI